MGNTIIIYGKSDISVSKNVADFLENDRKRQAAEQVMTVDTRLLHSKQFPNSKGHWSYFGSSKYTYMVVGDMNDGNYRYVCVCMDSENTDLK